MLCSDRSRLKFTFVVCLCICSVYTMFSLVAWIFLSLGLMMIRVKRPMWGWIDRSINRLRFELEMGSAVAFARLKPLKWLIQCWPSLF